MPRMTFTAGNDALASEVNTYLMDQAVQTYATSTARGSALPSPTEGQITYLNDVNRYEANHGGATWYPIAGQMPLVIYKRTTTQSIPNDNANATKLTYPTASTTRTGITYNAGDFTCANAGVYAITAWVSFNSNATGRRLVTINNNGALVAADNRSAPSSGAGNITVMTYALLAANDVISVTALQNSGAALTVDSATITISFVGP